MSSDPVVGCGLSWIWLLPANHAFLPACAKHDQAYNDRRDGKLNEDTSYYADIRFYGDMLEIAGNNRWLRLQAYALYLIARTYGKFKWPSPS